MPLSRKEVYRVGRSVCETMLGLPAGSPAGEAPPPPTPPFAACTHIGGVWTGVVAIDCPDAVARRAAGLMFSKAPADVTGEDVQDTVLEIANVVGGHVKALLPEACRLSVPSMVAGDAVARFCNTHIVTCVSVPVDGHTFTVTVLQTAE